LSSLPQCHPYLFGLHSLVLTRHLHSFPTRRSSDLSFLLDILTTSFLRIESHPYTFQHISFSFLPDYVYVDSHQIEVHLRSRCLRSEEHTSELQSRFDLVCRLLLEKKKITTVSRPPR